MHIIEKKVSMAETTLNTQSQLLHQFMESFHDNTGVHHADCFVRGRFRRDSFYRGGGGLLLLLGVAFLAAFFIFYRIIGPSLHYSFLCMQLANWFHKV
jgi:hypothetical protein